MSAAPATIALRGVSFTYRGSRAPALTGVDLEIGAGEMVVVMGASGAGKTTLAKLLNRTVPAFQPGELEGEVEIAGRRLGAESVADLAGTVGLVSQDFEAQLFATSVEQEVAFALEQFGVAPQEMRERVSEALSLVGLAGFERRDPGTLSGGEKQRLAIAGVLALRPRILVFDEPTTDLDPAGKEQVFDVLEGLRGRGYTIVLIEHEPSAAERADRLVLMRGGRIAACDRPAALLSQPDRLEELGVRPPERLRRSRPCLPAAVGEALIEVRDLVHVYPGGGRALDGVSLTIRRGEMLALVGHNGSGKTTLARHLNGLLKPTSGRVLLEGEDVSRIPLHRVAARVGYVFQDPDHQIFSATVRDEVVFGLRNFGVAGAELERRTAEAIRAVGLEGLEDADPFLLGKGDREQLAVASMLALRPQVLILDEPTTGLDYREQRQMLDLLAALNREGLTVVLITHSEWVVRDYARRVVRLRAGRIEEDS